jgi:AraC-like DNA-binding protein
MTSLPQVIRAGVFYNPPGTIWRHKDIAFLSANYVSCGTARCTANGQSLRFEAGHVYIWQPGDTLGGEVDEQLTSFYVRFRWPGWPDQIDSAASILELPKSVALSPAAQRDVQHVYDQLIEQFLAKRVGWEVACGGYVQVLLGLLQREAYDTKPTGTKPNPALDRRLGLALAFMESHLEGHPSVAEIAKAAHLSEDYFRRLFRQRLGLPPIQYLNRLRVSAARRLIAREPGMTVSEVGHQVGFDDVRYFARTFRQVYNMTPNAYRRSLSAQTKAGSQ